MANQPKNQPASKGFNWSSVPQNKTYENLKDWVGKTLEVVAVTDYVGDYSECFLLSGYDTDIPFDDSEPKLHQVLASKGYEGRDAVCESIRAYLAENPDEKVEITVKQYKRFYAIEQPR